MATLLEDEDLIAQAQERERARLEEEARILAFQQQIQDAPPYPLIPAPEPVWAGSPIAEIDAFNAAPGVISAPTTIGSEQYMNELARAQRGSGFVNADIGVSGNVITPGYDPLKDFAALKAQQEATNLQRNQYVDSLIKGGATYAEAYRAGQGRHPQTGNDAMRLKVEALALKTQPMRLETRVVNGKTLYRTGPNTWGQLRETAAKAVPGFIPPDVKREQDNLEQIATEKRAELRKGTKRMWSEKDGKTIEVELNADQKKALQDEIDAYTRNARELTNPGGKLREEYNTRVDQTGFNRARWDNPPPIPQPAITLGATTATPAQAQAVNEVRKLTKDGKVAVFDRKTEQFIRLE